MGEGPFCDQCGKKKCPICVQIDHINKGVIELKRETAVINTEVSGVNADMQFIKEKIINIEAVLGAIEIWLREV